MRKLSPIALASAAMLLAFVSNSNAEDATPSPAPAVQGLWGYSDKTFTPSFDTMDQCLAAANVFSQRLDYVVYCMDTRHPEHSTQLNYKDGRFFASPFPK